MIPLDFEYYRPVSVREAVDLFAELDGQGKCPIYYAGGTEVISFARLNGLSAKAVIDIKGIPECHSLGFQKDNLMIGAAVTLTRIQESGLFPMLSQSAGRVADHTIRGKITLGGNICSRIPYREAVLPLLATDSELLMAGPGGTRRARMKDAFQKSLLLQKGELLLSVHTDRALTEAPFWTFKRTKDGNVGYPQDRVGYPVVSMAACRTNGQIKAALSGACSYPFPLTGAEDALNHRSKLGIPEKLERIMSRFPEPVIHDLEGSAGYRCFVIRTALEKMLEGLGGG